MTYDDIINNIAHSGSTQLLVKLFGGQILNIYHSSSSYSGPQQTLFSIFGSVITFISIWLFVFVVIYFVFAGLFNQAQSGDFMKSNWSSVWPFLRVGFGITAFVPFPGTSLMLIQALVIAIALFASSAADLTWKAILSSAANAGIAAQPTLSATLAKAKTDAYLNEAYLYSACAANKINDATPDENVSLGSFNPVNPSDSESLSISLSCSSPKFQAFLESAIDANPPTPPDLTPQQGSDLVSDDTIAKFNSYQKAQYDYLTSQTIIDFIPNRVWPFVTSNLEDINANPNDASLISEWQQILSDFNNTLQSKIQSAVDSDKSMVAQVFTDQASLYGWISAGEYYRQLAQQQQIISNAISSSLQNTPGYINLSRQSDLTSANSMTAFGQSNADSLVGRASQGLSHLPHYLADILGLSLLKTDETSDPILAMASFGQKLEGVAEGALIGQQVIGFLSGIPVLGKALSVVNGLVDILIGAVAACGLLLGTVLPCMPWIIFMFAVLSWTIHVAEMFVAAPIWVVMNGIPDHNSLVNNIAKKGANNILFIVLFPILALGGLVASLGISWIGIGLLNQFAYSGFQAIIGIGTFPIAFVGMLILYAVLAWMVIINSLNLIQEFPRTILTWISLSPPSATPYQESHSSLVSLGTGQVSSVTHTATRTMAKAVTSDSRKLTSP